MTLHYFTLTKWTDSYLNPYNQSLCLAFHWDECIMWCFSFSIWKATSSQRNLLSAISSGRCHWANLDEKGNGWMWIADNNVRRVQRRTRFYLASYSMVHFGQRIINCIYTEIIWCLQWLCVCVYQPNYNRPTTGRVYYVRFRINGRFAKNRQLYTTLPSNFTALCIFAVCEMHVGLFQAQSNDQLPHSNILSQLYYLTRKRFLILLLHFEFYSFSV